MYCCLANTYQLLHEYRSFSFLFPKKDERNSFKPFLFDRIKKTETKVQVGKRVENDIEIKRGTKTEKIGIKTRRIVTRTMKIVIEIRGIDIGTEKVATRTKMTRIRRIGIRIGRKDTEIGRKGER